MKRKNKKPLTSSAEVVDNHLILSLTNANEPIVWRMALDKIGTASFEIKEIKTSGHHKLILKPKKGTAETIATFEIKNDALEALIQASDAMQKPAHSNKNLNTNEQKINIVAAGPTSQKNKQSKSKWLWLLLGLLIVIGLYSYLMSLMPSRIQDLGNTQTTNSAPVTPSNLQSGVPMSADDFLNNM